MLHGHTFFFQYTTLRWRCIPLLRCHWSQCPGMKCSRNRSLYSSCRTNKYLVLISGLVPALFMRSLWNRSFASNSINFLWTQWHTSIHRIAVPQRVGEENWVNDVRSQFLMDQLRHHLYDGKYTTLGTSQHIPGRSALSKPVIQPLAVVMWRQIRRRCFLVRHKVKNMRRSFGENGETWETCVRTLVAFAK